MMLWQKLAITLSVAALMEGFAWWAHRYIMHGWGWAWHRDHHEPHDHMFEKNDLFAVVFGSFAIVLFCGGVIYWARIIGIVEWRGYWFWEGGGRYVSLLGAHRWFHHPDDRWPGTVDLAKTERLTRAMLDVICALARA